MNKMLYHLDNTFRNGARENIIWVHIPVFFLASKTIITFCPYAPAALEVVEDTRPHAAFFEAPALDSRERLHVLVVGFPLRTGASSRVRHLELELPGTADRSVSDLLVACLEVLGVVVRTVRLALEHPHFERGAALRRGLQHELVALRRGDAPHRAGTGPATRAPAT